MCISVSLSIGSFEPKNGQVTFAKKPQMKLIHTLSNKAFKGTFVNLALPSLHGGSLETTLTVFLKQNIDFSMKMSNES